MSVPASDLEQVAEWQGLQGNWSRPGDILIVRFGWIEAFGKLNDTAKAAIVRGPGEWVGMKSDDESAEWLWNKKLAMVGGDNPAFESTPFGHPIGGDDNMSLHQLLISGK